MINRYNMKRFEELVVGDFAGMTTEQIADYIERAPQPYHTRQEIYEYAAECAREIFSKANIDN